ncbi:MAG: PQQ-dependent sugar dehydrogenase [bacterium]|nr:PQQ-dependent sugar dehydrogenase [bacterium]
MNKYLLVAIGFILIGLGSYIFERNKDVIPQATTSPTSEIKDIEVIAEGLEIPWDIAFLENGEFLVTERPGQIVKFTSDGSKIIVPYESQVQASGEGGLLGLVLHPDFLLNRRVYLYLSVKSANNETINRVESYLFENDKLVSKQLIIDNIPGAIYHDGGRMEFGPDRLLYITTGDATKSEIAQDKESLGGKILRLNDDGTQADGNPFGTAVYSFGHRNPQGLAWDREGRLWETEHGRSGVMTGMDEINLISSGLNYGWPLIEGSEKKEGLVGPVRHSGSKDTWAPASLAYLDGSLYFGGLKGEALYEAVLNGEKIVDLKEHLVGQYGRIRTVRVGPDGFLYITTSNRDGRGEVRAGDDKIIRVDTSLLN